MAGPPCLHWPTKFDESESLDSSSLFLIPSIRERGLKGVMRRSGKLNQKTNRAKSALFLFSFSFLIFCSAGLINCPKGFSWNHSNTQEEIAERDLAPCHQVADEGTESSNPCQCMEISKTEDTSQFLAFANLLRISLQTVFLIPTFELNAVSFVIQTNQHLSITLHSHSLIHQKTIKLLI